VQHRLNDKAQERAELRRAAEYIAFRDAVDRRANFVARRRMAGRIEHRCHNRKSLLSCVWVHAPAQCAEIPEGQRWP